MKKQIMMNLGSNYVLSFSGMALGFFLIPFLIGKLGQELFGTIVLAESTIAFFEVLTVSVRQALSRHATFALSQDKMDEFIDYLATGRRIFVRVAAFVLLLGGALSAFFPVLFQVPAGYDTQSQGLFFLITIAFVLSIPNSVYWSALYAKQRFDLINFSTSLGLVLRALCLFAFYTFAPAHWVSLTAYGVIHLLMTLLQNGLILRWSRGLLPRMKLPARRFSREKAREILSFSTHSSLTRVSSLLHQNTLNILINLVWGPAMNAVYSVSVKVPWIVYRIFVETTWVLTTTFTDLAARNEREKAENLMLAFSKVLSLGTYPLLWSLILLSGPIIHAWVGPELAQAGELMPVAMLFLFASIPASVAGCVINAHAKVRLPSQVNFVAAIVNLVACYLLGVTFEMGLFGILLASAFFGITLNLLFYPSYACGILGVPAYRYYRESIAKPFLASALFVGAAFAVFRVVSGQADPAPLLFVCLAAACALYFFTAYHWLLNDFEKQHLRETLGSLVRLLNKPFERDNLSA